MPQMAPLLWLYLYMFFLISLILFLVINYFIKPFEYIDSSVISTPATPQLNWKL
uniref:ATP synthase F0 subunit 8 n=1 Tax=Portunus sanguinolentus TaxID=411673 RepID=A0A0P0DQP2_9EUCA|nr:ATP synthase F0 subunit 8 [Portunus sanguinolentus]ALJ10994.1 ATP synthase F0 subunit 8 [Portunus sanguinolentus]ALK60817.1 ATP synthase F0 subunit 8 [Portunus sanguinolentus]